MMREGPAIDQSIHFQGDTDDPHFAAFVRSHDDRLKRDADPATGLVGGLALETKAGRAAGLVAGLANAPL